MKHSITIITVLVSLFIMTSCQDLLMQFASLDNIMADRDIVNSVYNYYLGDVAPAIVFGEKDMVKEVWRKGSFPHIVVLDNNGNQINVQECFANFENVILFFSTRPDMVLDSMGTLQMDADYRQVLGNLYETAINDTVHRYNMFFMWAYKMGHDSLIFETLQSGYSIIDSLGTQKNINIQPVNIDFIKSEWKSREVKRFIMELGEG